MLKKNLFTSIIIFALISACAPVAQPEQLLPSVGTKAICVKQDRPSGWDTFCDYFTAAPTTVPNTPTSTTLPPTATRTTNPPSVTPSNVPSTLTRTPTSVPPTPTRTQPVTNTPSGNIPPFVNAPLCPTHNNTAWHGLWDSARGCHYDHAHGDNPALGDTIFGAAGLWGQQISYPWATPNENDPRGHVGYFWYVNTSPKDFNGTTNCSFESYGYLGSNLGCVTAFRILYHEAGGNAHMVKRFHSYYMEVQIKKGSTVGIIRTGGWADFGCLHSSYKDTFLPLPGIDPTLPNTQTQCGSSGGQSIHDDPYRAFGNTWAEIQGQTSGDNFSIWTTDNDYGYNLLGRFFFRTLDAWGAIDPANPYEEHLICPDFRCKYNNSEHHVFNVFMTIPSSMGVNGVVNYTGWTDRRGNVVTNCTVAGVDCVPLQMVNVPVGTAIWSRNLSGLRPEGDPVKDTDLYFNGQPSGWIIFPH